MNSDSRKIRVLVVDDSAVVRKLVTDALHQDSDIEVVGTAMDPYFARDKILQLEPDVITLDLEMPRMDGLTFLKIIMERRPMPVIIMSSLTQTGSDKALEALQLGAVDVLGKPSGSYSFGELGPQLIAKIKAAASAKVRRRAPSATTTPVERKPTAPITRERPSALKARANARPRDLILLGASTGGTEALREILTQLPWNLPPIAIVQHIPPVFSKSFADRLNTLCAFEVREAVEGDRLQPGLALIAPGNFHMMLQWQTDHYRVRLSSGPTGWHQRPAVDILFKSALDGAGPHVTAGILTGMGKDGADSILGLRDRRAPPFPQHDHSSLLYYIPPPASTNPPAPTH